MNRLKTQKGFTLVEVIVVIAIIAVLSAIMLPMFANSGKPQEAVAKAQSFYYAAQNVFIDYKAKNVDNMTEGYFTFIKNAEKVYAKDAATGKNATYLYVCAYAERDKGFTSVGVAVSADTATSQNGYVCMADPVTFTSGELLDALNGYSTEDDYGYYYALVDSQCRVQACYWSQQTIGELSDNGSGEFKKSSIEFASNDKIDNYIVGAFPADRSAIDAIMFDAA